ncbi:putative sugar dehydratase [uncultured Desulfobacterium sp.]|uniref:Putative sugar dehydratase n=1 Tax=uncultured Desulfobacterium sp. TaxID=201089 RepID=A0A445MXG3_9BACT|nr:putative sugar dehydratase [uncultured Desulfobacterium sp.]
MRNVLVIGGSYFAGRVFVETLAKSDQYRIHVFNRGHIPIGIPGVQELLGDREIPDAISRGIPWKRWDVVVDFCAYTPGHITTLLQSIPGTIGHYIFISTTSIYAPTQKTPVSEQSRKVDGPQPELGEFAEYGYQKWLAECTCEGECGQKGVSYTILRPTIIYGRYNYAPRESYLFDCVIADKPFVIPENINIFYSFVWVDDLAEILIACMENGKTYGQAYNVAGEEQISYTIMADVLEKVCGRPIQRKLMTTDEIIRKKIPMPFPPDDHLLYDGSRLRRVLGYEHTPFTVGITKTWQHYQAVIQRRIVTQGG